MWTKGQGVQAADGAIHSYRAQIAELESEHASVVSDQRVVLAELQEALDRAVAIVLPDASAPTLALAAGELGAGWLPRRRQELEQKRSEWIARLAQIERDAYFVRRQALLHATRGEIASERQKLEAALAAIEQRRAHFDNETFMWVLAREAEQQVDRGALGSFWDAVTFSGYRIDRAKGRCAKELGFGTYEEVVVAHQAAELERKRLRRRLKKNEALRTNLLAMLEEHARLYTWTHEFEARLCEMLRAELRQALAKGDLRAVHGAIRADARLLVAQAHALSKKAEYLDNLAAFLNNQMEDRKGRVNAIQKTRVAWAMKPWDRIPGNKSKWLVSLPAAKKQSTHKVVKLSRRMHHNVIEYEDYDDYSYYLGHSPTFLAYDAFAYGAEEAMPYEGFSREVVPDLATYRSENDQARPDYGAFRSMDKQAVAEDRAAAAAAVQSEAEVAPEDGDVSADESGGDEAEGTDAGDQGSEDFGDAEAGLSTDEAGGDMEDSS